MRTDQTDMTNAAEVVLAVSLELATAKWKVALHDGRRDSPAIHTVAQLQSAARLQAVLSLIEQHRQKWALPASTRVVVSYEAAQDAFWICRALQARGIECYVVDPASIPVERHKRRAKTDRFNVIKLIINLFSAAHASAGMAADLRRPPRISSFTRSARHALTRRCNVRSFA
jgi:transposase